MKANQSVDQKARIPLSTKLAYGFGSTAFGVKNNGFDYFLLFFYTVVLGYDSALISIALLIALVFDAVSDPVVGYLSDNLHSRWGRRHPFMYASMIPVPVSFYFLWAPPADMTDTQTLIYLTVLAVIIRTFITLYETPSSSLAPEMTDDYDERTSLLSFRYFFGWVGGNMMSVIAFGLIFSQVTADHPNGRLNPDLYSDYGFVAALIIFLGIAVSTVGTHKHIPNLKAPPPKRKRSLKDVFAEIFETLSERSFIPLFVAALFSAIATGTAAGLAFIMLNFFWEFTNEQIFIWTTLIFISAALALAITPPLSRRFGKKKTAIATGAVAFFVQPFMVVLRLVDWLPANGTDELFWIVCTVNTLDIALIICMSTLFGAMLADLVEESQTKTHRRSEGVFFATITFVRKSTQGIGVFIAGLILSFSNMPSQPKPGDISEETLVSLGWMYVIALWTLWSVMLIAIGFYKIDKAKHQANVAQLKSEGQL